MALNTNGISFTGLASGMDTSKLIQQLVALESQPIQQMQTKQQSFQSKLSAVGTLKGLVSDLQTQAGILSKNSSFLSFLSTVSVEGHVAASASGSASAGTHTVTVNQLATIDRWTFNPVAATVVNIGTTAAPSYQLVMTSKASGEANRISGITQDVAGLSIDATGPSPTGAAQSANNITVGMNAIAVIDGLAVTRETNEFN